MLAIIRFVVITETDSFGQIVQIEKVPSNSSNFTTSQYGL